jgi:hypothetical protein
MDQNQAEQAAPARVRFGTRADDTMPVSWADRMMMKWRHDHPAQFGKALAAAVVDDAE